MCIIRKPVEEVNAQEGYLHFTHLAENPFHEFLVTFFHFLYRFGSMFVWKE